MSGFDGLRVESPNEIILFNSKNELDYFLDTIKAGNISPENFKLLGNLMMKLKFYEKAIFYYQKAINENNINKKNYDTNDDIIFHSNLSEAKINLDISQKVYKMPIIA